MKKRIINYVLLAISLISFLVVYFLIKKVDVIPNKFVFLFFIIELILLISGVVLSLFKKKACFIISIIISILLIIINSCGYYYIRHLDKFLDKGFTGDIISTSKYYVITSKNNKVTNMDQITLDIPINYYAYSKNVNEAFDKLGKYDFKTVENINEYLLNHKESNEYLLIDKINYFVSFELNKELDENDYKIIYEYDVVTSEKRNNEVKEIFNVLITGKDFSDERNDLNMIVTVNMNTKKILITSIPRDFYIPVSGSDKKDTLMVMGYYGDEIVSKSIGDFFNITIDYRINLYARNLVDIVDKIGGIEYCSDMSYYTNHSLVIDTYDDTRGKKFYVRKGCHEVNGIQALTIARERIAFKSEFKRQDNCRQIMLKIANKVLSTSTLSNYTSILDSFNNLYTTTINRNTAVTFIKSVISNNYEIIEQSVKGTEANRYLRMGYIYGFVIEPNMDTVNNAISKMQEIINE